MARIQIVENPNAAAAIAHSHKIFEIAYKLSRNAMSNPERMAELEEDGLVTTVTRYPLKFLKDINGDYVRGPDQKPRLIEDRSRPIVTKYVSTFVYWDAAKKIVEEESL